MFCPSCQKNLEKTLFYGVEIDYCPKCLGLWFEEDELRLAKDEKDKNLNWLDIDLWKDRKKFKIALSLDGSSRHRLCPFCRLPLYGINYDKSSIMVDLCNLCHGIWLDRGEFKNIIEYLKDKKDYEIFHNLNKKIIKEFWEIFAGPQSFKEEASDLLSVLKVLIYKFSVNHPTIEKIISSLPK